MRSLETTEKIFESKVAYHCAPALLGIKPACLCNFPAPFREIAKSIRNFNQKAVVKGLKMQVLCTCEKKTLLYVYHGKNLLLHLREPHTAVLLQSFGYDPDQTLAKMLSRLRVRIRQSADFPHEIGLFLGYPAVDVQGFITHKGRDYKLCGAWKVYGDEKKAQRTFDNYGKCRRYLCGKLHQGQTIYQALRIA